MKKLAIGYAGVEIGKAITDLEAAKLLMFWLEEHHRETAQQITSTFVEMGWPYSQSGLGFGQQDSLTEVQQETLGLLVEDCEDALERIAPEGCYFGKSNDCYGFWADEED